MRRTLGGLGHSLRGRLLAGTLAWILASVLVAGWALSDLFRQHLSRQLAQELNVHMNQLAAALSVNDQGVASLGTVPGDPRLDMPYSGLYWQIDRLGTTVNEAVFHSRSLWDQTLHVPDTLQASGTSLAALTGPGDTPMLLQTRVIRPPEGNASYRLTVATDAAALNKPLQQFHLMLAITLGVLALGLTMAAIMQVVVGLRPLAQLRKQLANVRQGRQSRIQTRFPSEVQPLVDEFNQVLKNSNDVVQRARTQAGNLAHALKTPLSVLANGAQNENTPFGRLVAEQVAVARTQVDHHLARARAAAAVRTPGVITPVGPVVAGLARVLGRLYIHKGLQIHTDPVPDTLGFLGEQHDLQDMLGNLMENACKWADRNVWVHAQPGDADTLVLTVDDDGPGLPEAQREQAFGRGVRLDERTPGSGLGLSIVRDLAQAYGGTAHAHASAHGGLQVVLVLPASQGHQQIYRRNALTVSVNT
jgi:signal transduction histidine kinase